MDNEDGREDGPILVAQYFNLTDEEFEYWKTRFLDDDYFIVYGDHCIWAFMFSDDPRRHFVSDLRSNIDKEMPSRERGDG